VSDEPTPQSIRVGPRRIRRVLCAQCERPSDARWRGWRAYRVDDAEAGEPPEIAFFCPACCRPRS